MADSGSEYIAVCLDTPLPSEVANSRQHYCNMLKAKSPRDVIETALRWRDIGGTHVSVVTMGQNFRTIDQHIDYMKVVADAVRSAGL